MPAAEKWNKKNYSGKMIIEICLYCKKYALKKHYYSAFVISLAEESVIHSPIKAMGSLKNEMSLSRKNKKT